ncbi:MAG: hypothetical protein C5S40_06380 [ANME-2 cluster archaeon]|nr:hypothetical protein [ANME-2 cluster archaeon]
MDMTGWLEYFVEGLATQMQEMVERGKGAMHNDLIVKQYELKERQAKALKFFLENDVMYMRDMEALCPEVNRRTLQRDLRQMEALGIIRRKGAARQSYYVLGNKVQ